MIKHDKQNDIMTIHYGNLKVHLQRTLKENLMKLSNEE